MGIKAALTAIHHNPHPIESSGFEFAPVVAQHFDSPMLYDKALREQESAVDYVPGVCVEKIDEQGVVAGTPYRLSSAAFSDLCHWAALPVKFIKKLSTLNMDLALEVVDQMIASVFHAGPKKSLVVDARHNRVEGIVGADSYSPIPNHAVLTWCMSSGEMTFAQGWLEGPDARFTFVDATNVAEPKPGDVVRYGVSMRNGIHGDTALEAASHYERQTVKTGLTDRSKEACYHIVHRGDPDVVADEAMKAIVKAHAYATKYIVRVEQAAEHLMMPNEVRLFRSWVSAAENGGNKNLDATVVSTAKREAILSGRQEEEVTLWDFVSGVAEGACSAPSMNRRMEIEAMGMKALKHFTDMLCKPT